MKNLSSFTQLHVVPNKWFSFIYLFIFLWNTYNVRQNDQAACFHTMKVNAQKWPSKHHKSGLTVALCEEYISWYLLNTLHSSPGLYANQNQMENALLCSDSVPNYELNINWGSNRKQNCNEESKFKMKKKKEIHF